MEGFLGTKEIHRTAKSPHRKQYLFREETNVKKERKINRVRCDIQSHIIAAGYTQKEAVELADVLGYEIVWQKRREA